MRGNRLPFHQSMAGSATAALTVLAVVLLSAVAFAAPTSALKAGNHELSVHRNGLTSYTVFLDGKRLLQDRTDEVVTLAGDYEGDGHVYVLLSLSPGGNACASQYRAIDLSGQQIIITPPFGNCSDQPKVSVELGALHVRFPPFTAGGVGNTAVPGQSYSFKAGVLTKRPETPAAAIKPQPGFHFVHGSGMVHLYYNGPNNIGPSIFGGTARNILNWPPEFKSLKSDTVRGVSLGMTLDEADRIAQAIPMQSALAAGATKVTVWYENLGPRAAPIDGMPNVSRVTCDPDAVKELAFLATSPRQNYGSCLAFYPAADGATTVGRISSVQHLDKNSGVESTMAALVAKYGPPSQQPALNEMLWFAKDKSGRIVAIDALYSDINAYYNPQARAEAGVTSGGPKILDVEMEYFDMPAPAKASKPASPQL